jgi:PAS domain S-box-containing protein
MAPKGRESLIFIKKDLIRDPIVIAVLTAAITLLFTVNVAAFVRGTDAPWLLGAVILADMLVVVASSLGALWAVAVWGGHSDRTEARLDAIVDSAMDAIVTVDGAQRIVQFNRAAERMFRCPRAKALGAPLERFLPPRFRETHHAHVEAFGRTGITSRRMGDQSTLWALRADGEEFPIEASISQSGEGALRQYTVILRDITLRLERDRRLERHSGELRELSARVLEAREEEKTLIARELHDELGQLLTALKMDLAWLRARGGAPGELGPRLAAMDEIVDRMVGSTRRIAADLRPLMLDDLGLADAVHWLVDDFAGRSGVRCELEMDGEDAFDALDPKVATTVYRALQESLTNVAKHAGATRVRVALRAAAGEVLFEVEDDGRGIDPADLDKSRSLGLKGMRERVTYLGGRLEVARGAPRGTRVRAHVPLHASEAA